MRAAAHDKELADKLNISQEVAREFVEEDKKARGQSIKQEPQKKQGKQEKTTSRSSNRK